MSRHIYLDSNGKLIEEEESVQDGSAILNPDSAVPGNDPVNNPFHYQSFHKDGIDCITAMRHAFGDDVVAAFCKCNAMKYIWRESSKGGNESIQKAIWYLNKYLELNK